VRKQYHLRRTERGFDAWDVDRLIRLTQDLPVRRVRLDAIGELERSYWFHDSGESPTVRKVVEHARLISEVDLGFPIILDHEGRVIDGMHRVARALLERLDDINAVQLSGPVEPDYRDCEPDQLPY
jgi:hypothetical protein